MEQLNKYDKVENLIWVDKDLTTEQNELISNRIKKFLEDWKEGKYEQLYAEIY